METRQLVLIDSNGSEPDQWRLDDRTRQVGREGIAAARQALRDALAHHDAGHPDNEDTQSTAA
ncbi:hypothetical protein [Actinomarinicola tropica]|uniref:Uncharacterized protein n=1 Tax=Actinomarinicola tropica TaxID=2789776 RepID=A0A5Q2RK55_9ACTN|nr:hypothetical protein [Actinomarinicola tropica]QGG94776.1 hypothetical protein GH723_06440 [Actinomarinicola tropica]